MHAWNYLNHDPFDNILEGSNFVINKVFRFHFATKLCIWMLFLFTFNAIHVFEGPLGFVFDMYGVKIELTIFISFCL